MTRSAVSAAEAIAIVSEARTTAERISAAIGTGRLPRRLPMPLPPADTPQPAEAGTYPPPPPLPPAATPPPAVLDDEPGWHDVAALWAVQLREITGPLRIAHESTLRPMLIAWLRQLPAAARATPPEPAAGARVGRALVDAGLTDAAVLGRSIELLSAHLPTLDDEVPAPAGAVCHIMAALAAGFVDAVRDFLRTEHESMLRALDSAHRQQALTWRAPGWIGPGRRPARYDPLTGLPTRVTFEERATTALARHAGRGHIGLCMVDLSGFKAVNDMHGIAIGDLVLGEVACRLQQLVL